MLKKIAFRIVFKTLLNDPTFCGNGGKNISLHYMNGILSVMLSIADRLGEKTKSDFYKQFVKNLKESRKN